MGLIKLKKESTKPNPFSIPLSNNQKSIKSPKSSLRSQITKTKPFFFDPLPPPPHLLPPKTKMSLSDQLNKFKKQQVQCQSTLSDIASTRASIVPPPPSRSSVPQAVSQKPNQTAPIRFSNDTERLQMINSIRKSPVGAQMKRVIELLYETRQAFTVEQINERCYVDMRGNKAVFDSMRNNSKAHFDGRRFSYKSTHDVKDKKQLLLLIKKYPDGIEVKDLKDGYPNVLEDLQALKGSKDIWLLTTTANAADDVAYPNDLKVNMKIDDDFKALFRNIEVPSDMLDVERELLKIGLKPASNTAERRAAEQMLGVPSKSKTKKKKKQEISKRTKLTNAHLPELFQNLSNPSSSRN